MGMAAVVDSPSDCFTISQVIWCGHIMWHQSCTVRTNVLINQDQLVPGRHASYLKLWNFHPSIICHGLSFAESWGAGSYPRWHWARGRLLGRFLLFFFCKKTPQGTYIQSPWDIRHKYINRIRQNVAMLLYSKSLPWLFLTTTSERQTASWKKCSCCALQKVYITHFRLIPFRTFLAPEGFTDLSHNSKLFDISLS